MRIFIYLYLCVASLSLTGCKKNEPNTTSFDNTQEFKLAKGADISWLTEMEHNGILFYNNTGEREDVMAILKNLGINTIRLRVWVNPTGGYNNLTDLIAKAQRAKSYGMRLLINFHYSDTWADPGNQTKPLTWNSNNIGVLKDSLIQHTELVLNTLKQADITPEWVQIGNETNNGMLWPEGKASINMANFAQLISSGYQSTKKIFPSTKVIVHVSNGWDNSLFRWLFDGLKNNDAYWDVIGLSLYPTAQNWATLNSQCLSNMKDMISRYHKEIMVVEVGMSWDQDSACYLFLNDLITKINSLPNQQGLGIVYWEPQAYNNWKGYTLGAFNNMGNPTQALKAFTE